MYEKARSLVDEGRVTLQEETDKRVYLEVEGSHDTYGVRLASDHTFSCTCPYATMRGIPKGALCSHVLAALILLSEADGPWLGETDDVSRAGSDADDAHQQEDDAAAADPSAGEANEAVDGEDP